MDIVRHLLIIYTAILFINIAISAILWAYAKAPLYRDVFFLWLTSILSLFVQGLFVQNDLVIILAFSSAFLINITLSNLISKISDIEIPWKLFGLVLLGSYPAAVALFLAGASFTLVALPVVLAVSLPAMFTASKMLVTKWNVTSISAKSLSIITCLLAVHNIDFAFLRPVESFAPIGFSIAVILIFCLSIFAPAVVLEVVTKKEATLKEVDRLKSTFFANISHEIRTPLTMILSPIESALQGDYGQKLDDEFLRALHRHALRLLNLINNLLDFSKLEAGRTTMTVRKVDVVRLLKTYVGTISSSFEAKRIKIDFVSLNRSVPLFVDIEKMDKIVMNLFSNALKFTEPGGMVNVRLRDDEERCYIEIEDTGIGIPKDKTGFIFDRFTQADSSSTRKYEGTGIGLALAKEYVELHGGSISVESRYIEQYPERHGTTFEVMIPKGTKHLEDLENYRFIEDTEVSDSVLDHKFIGVEGAERSARLSEEEERAAEDTAPGVDVLVVEDDPDLRSFLRKLLEAHYTVLTAANGEEGLSKAKRSLPQVVLTDVMMPVMTGHEMTRLMKADDTLKAIPILMLTAKAEIVHKLEGLEYGADDYLTKPFNSKELLARVRSLLRLKQTQNELVDLNRNLAAKVQEQVMQMERLGKLKRFFSPQLVEMIIDGKAEDPLQVHRREITVVFLDLRGFTAFSETAEPEDVMDVLHEYHSEMGKLILAHEGTLERFAGDGMMVFFNDPTPVENAEELAIRMALAMKSRMEELTVQWRERGLNLGIGFGLASGYATIGAIGFEGRWDYGAIGTVTNLAARLCGEAKSGQILIPQRFLGKIQDLVDTEVVGELTLRGFHRPVAAFNVQGLRN